MPATDAPTLLLATGGHQIEAAETLIEAGRFIVILFAARALAELMVRLRQPAILGELVAGVLLRLVLAGGAEEGAEEGGKGAVATA